MYYYLYYYLRDFPYLDKFFFFFFVWVQNTHISLSLSKDRTKEQQKKNTSLTSTKTLPTKNYYSPTNPLIHKQTSHLNSSKKKFKVKLFSFFIFLIGRIFFLNPR